MSKRHRIKDSVLGAVICTAQILLPLAITAGNFLLLR